MLSIGSGEPGENIEMEELKLNEKLFWPHDSVPAYIQPLDQARAANTQAQSMLPAGNYIRLQPDLEDEDDLIALDAVGNAEM